jgi:hypothetical protein
MKPYLAAVTLVLFVAGLAVAAYVLQPDEGEVVSQTGLHWHARIRVVKGGEEVAVPANMGLGAVHNPVHTHEDPGVIHMEFGGRVLQDDLKLQEFLAVWNPGLGDIVSMTVNGLSNAEFGNYHMRDGDVIELFY